RVAPRGGAEMWIFSRLGYPPEVGLAVGLAVRLRELVWMLPGLLYLTARGLVAPLARLRTGLRHHHARHGPAERGAGPLLERDRRPEVDRVPGGARPPARRARPPHHGSGVRRPR